MLQDFSVTYDGGPNKDAMHIAGGKIMSEIRAEYGIPDSARGAPRDHIFGLFGDQLVFRTSLFSQPVRNGTPTFIPSNGSTVNFLARLSCRGKEQSRVVFHTEPKTIYPWLMRKLDQTGSTLLPGSRIQSSPGRTGVVPVTIIAGTLIAGDITDLVIRGIGGNRAYGCGIFLFADRGM